MTEDERQKIIEARARFKYLAPLDMLTLEEIDSLRKEAREAREYYRKAFAHLRPKAPDQKR